jgi:iron-sulfur cluster insertion protein
MLGQGVFAMGEEKSTNVELCFSDKAAHKVRALVLEEENDDLMLRVFVTGGGCSGFEYGFTFDEEVEEDDTEVVNNGVSLLVDSLSYQYLTGSVIDYLEDLQGSRFVVSNPNAINTCGCGNSFSI